MGGNLQKRRGGRIEEEKGWKAYIPRLYKKKASKNRSSETTSQDMEEEDTAEEKEEEVAGRGEARMTSFKPSKFYEDLNKGYILSRLEEPLLLTTALRIIVRNIHPN